MDLTYWNHIYDNFDPIAFNIFGFNVHWYGIMYIIALFLALFIAKFLIKRFNFLEMSDEKLDSYFVYVELGVILGARLGYILIYSNHAMYYLSHPLLIFSPYDNDGNFVGIRGMSYHGAAIGFILGSYIFSIRHKMKFWKVMDLATFSVPLAYTFGRIGNFLNKELFGRVTDVPWGIYVNGVLRHPSQLYEGFLEGIVTFCIMYIFARNIKVYKAGKLTAIYSVCYGTFRIVSEFFREPDVQIGYLLFGATMGQMLSIIMIVVGVLLFFKSSVVK